MAVQIIVDGYNYIGGQRGLQKDIEAQREKLIHLLGQYRSKKGYEVTVVFDGLRSGWPDEHGERREGIDVVFSRQGETADDVIIRMARELGSACVVVSSDREVARSAIQAGGVSIETKEFERKLYEAGQSSFSGDEDELDLEEGRSSRRRGNPRKLKKEDRKKRQRLNKL